MDEEGTGRDAILWSELLELTVLALDGLSAELLTSTGGVVARWARPAAGPRLRAELLARLAPANHELVEIDERWFRTHVPEPGDGLPPPAVRAMLVPIPGDDAAVAALLVLHASPRSATARERMILRLAASQVAGLRRPAPAPIATAAAPIDEVADQAPFGLLRVDRVGKIVRINPWLLHNLGYARAELERHANLLDLVTAEDARALRERHGRHGTGAMDLDLRRRDGSWLRLRAASTPSSDEEPGCWIVLDQPPRTSIDDTPRWAAAAARHQVDQLTRTLADADLLFAQWSEGSDQLTWRGATEAWFGADFDPSLAAFRERVHPDDRPGLREFHDRLADQSGPSNLRYRLRDRHGAYRWVESRTRRTTAEGGDAAGSAAIIVDIDALVATEARSTRAERTLASVMESVDDAVSILDADGRVVAINGAALRGINATRADAVGRRLLEELMVPRHAAALQDNYQTTRDHRVVTLFEFHDPLSDIDYAIRFCPADDGGVIATSSSRAGTRDGALERLSNRLRALSTRFIAVREHEALRLSRELHDGLGQLLTAIKLDLTMLRQQCRPDTPPDICRRLADLETNADLVFAGIRQMAAELRPGMLDDLGLAATLEWYARDAARRGGLRLELDLADDERPLTNATATALYRITQEAVHNVLQHAHATTLRVALAGTDDGVEIIVTDDGVGLEAGALDRPTSLGVLGMHERAIMIGGRVALTRAPAGGTVVTIRAPRRDG